MIDLALIATVAAAAIRIATPILFAALGEAVVERAGVLNIGIEGMMIVGGFVGFFVAAHAAGDPWIGLAAALIAGAVAGLVYGFIVIERGADHVVTGIVFNILCLGLASFSYRLIFTGANDFPELRVMRPFRVPWLSDIDVVGKVFFSHIPIVYIAFSLVPVFWFVLNRCSWGLCVRAVGENPVAAESAGIDVWRIRHAAILVGGAMAALGGATLSIGQVGSYLDNMTAGRGFIALAVVVFGGWNPWRVAGAALIFGGAEAIQLRLQALGFAVPPALLLAVPYLLTIIVITVFAGRANYPSAINQPYPRRRGHGIFGILLGSRTSP